MGICNSIGKLIYKFSLYLPNNEKRMITHLKRGGGKELVTMFEFMAHLQ